MCGILLNDEDSTRTKKSDDAKETVQIIQIKRLEKH